MSVPIILPYGYVCVYGLGTTLGTFPTLIPSENSFKFGTIYQIGNNMAGSLINETILFDSTSKEVVICQLAWDTVPYTIVNYNKIIATEDIG